MMATSNFKKNIDWNLKRLVMVNNLSSIFIAYLITISFIPVFADESYTARSSGNKTVVVQWTTGDTEPNHVLKCIAEGNPLPSLSWNRDDNENFTSSEGIVVDVSKPEEISITFTPPISYSIFGDYICVASSPGTKTIFVDFRVFVETSKSAGMVVGSVAVLTLFLVAAFFICKTLRINDSAVQMEK